MVKMIQIIHGKEYEVEVGRNYLIGESIKGDKCGYELRHSTDGITSKISSASALLIIGLENTLLSTGTITFPFLARGMRV